MKNLSMSEARHDFNNFPRYFETDPEPVLVSHQDEPVMAIISFGMLTGFVNAVEFLRSKGLLDEFNAFLETQFGQEHEHNENCSHAHHHDEPSHSH